MYDMDDLERINLLIKWCKDYTEYVREQDRYVHSELDIYASIRDCIELSQFMHDHLIFKLECIITYLNDIKDFILEDNDKFNGE